MLAGRSRSLLGLLFVVAAIAWAADPLEVVPLTYSPVTQYVPVSALVSATGGTPPYTWSLAGGSLPTGLELSAAGFINGTPTVAGQFSFSPQVRDSQGNTATRSLSITIQPSVVNTLVTEPARLSFTLTEGSSATQQACVSISATQRPVEVRGSFAPVSWLSASGTAIQQTPATYCLTANASGLAVRSFPYVHYFLIGSASISDFAIGTSVEVSLTIQPAVGNILTASPSELTFTLPEGTSKSAPSCISVFSTQGPVQVESYMTGTWLTATGAILQQTPASYCITADATGLAPRSYTTYFTSTYRNLVDAPSVVSVPVTVNIQAAANPARLEVSPPSLKLTALRGGPAVNGSVLLTNSGGSSLSYTVRRPEASWLTTTAVLGDLSGGSSTSLPVRADPTGLSAGVYRSALVIDALGSQHVVDVELSVAGSPGLLGLS